MGGKNTLENELHGILRRLTLSRSDRKKYPKDAEDICNYIMNEMKNENKLFKCLFNGLSLTGSYLDNVKIKRPDEFDYQIKLKLPSDMIPERIPKIPACVCLRVNEQHRFVQDNYVQRHRVQTWMRNILNKIFQCSLKLKPPKTSNGSYELTYESKGYSIAHTIKAKNLRNNKTISFDFVPVFEFPPSAWCFSENPPPWNGPWFAVPLKRRGSRIDQKAFKVCAANWEEQILENKMNLKNTLRIMKGLRDTTGMTTLASYMLKTAYLIEIDKQESTFWEKSIGEIILHMIRQLINYLAFGILPFYWDRNDNLFHQLDYSTRKKFWETLENAEIALKGVEYDRPRFMQYFKS